jgi:uncharacterized spore protein YtfJ
MGSLAILQSLKESVLGQASVKAIYGEPISAQGKTVIPVARVMYAYGAGAGTGGVGDTSARGEGGGGVVVDERFPSALSRSATSRPVSFRLPTERS